MRKRGIDDMYSVLKNVERLIDVIVDTVLVIALLIGVYYIYDSLLVFRNAGNSDILAYKPDRQETETLKKLSDDCVGWLTIYDTKIDYPVMQGKDNSEYLEKDPYGVYSPSGSIFLDSRNAKDFTDTYSLIYGHHMAGGYMFGALDDFADRVYFDKHRKGEMVIDGKYCEIETFAFVNTDAGEGMVFDPEREGNRADWARNNASIYVEPAGERIVALSTCKSPTGTARSILFVSIIDE